MDDEKKQQLIESAKRSLRITYDFTSVQESIFLQIQEAYIEWNDADWLKLGKLPALLEQAEKGTKRYLRETKGLPYLYGPEVTKKDLSFIKFFQDNLDWETDYFKDDPWNPYIPKKGRPENRRLHYYIGRMAGWYNEFFKEPAYGSYSIFTRLVGGCLAIINESYIDNPPYKAIKNVILAIRKRFPHGLPPAYD